MGLMEKIFGSYSKKELKIIQPIVAQVLSLEDKYTNMTESELKSQTEKLKKRLENAETLNDILPDAFAVCREASWRVLGMKHFPVQIIGGIVLHQGRIAEMRTGEGKTLVATLPAYLNALSGDGVNVVTVNDYLAKRDAEWMGKLYKYLGLTVGVITQDIFPHQRKEQYACDITYGTNNEFGFDYLRDNMAIYKNDQCQRGHNFAIVDEVDSILIDEARTPLIISGQGEKSTELYNIADKFARTLTIHKVAEVDDKESQDDIEADFIVDEKAKTSTLTPNGAKKAESYFKIENLMDAEHMTLQHHINQAIKAHGIMKKDIDYVVTDGEVIIIDEFTGRQMIGRRYNEGLHQAIEAKEGVKVARESKTLATVTFQNYFRLYKKLSGMTGTGLTEEGEFREIYKLDVVEIPTNNPIARIDLDDAIYKTENAKYNAVIEEIIEANSNQQPVLVGTISIEKSELLSKMLKKRGIKHNVLNAKQHEREAEIISQAGKLGAVTIATNMAGRGTDIMLGGNAEHLATSYLLKKGYSDEIIADATGHAETDNQEILNARKEYQEQYNKYKETISEEAEKVKQAGGLFIVGTERHESRRIDNQLRGRAGRQGDSGKSKFFLSLEDDLMRLFGGEKVTSVMNMLKIDENQPIETKILTNSIESAQRKVEGKNFAIRKSVLQFDDVMNRQREIIYSQREKVLNGEDVKEYIIQMIKDMVKSVVNEYLPANGDVHDNWNIDGLRNHFLGFITNEDDLQYDDLGAINKNDIIEDLTNRALDIYKEKEENVGLEVMRELERVVLLRNVDSKWMDHIDAMDELRRGIYLRAYAQRDPVVEYRYEGFEMFDAMIEDIRNDTVEMLFKSKITVEGNDGEVKLPERKPNSKPIKYK